MSALLKQPDLLEWTGYKRPADLENWLKENRIPYRKGKGGELVTTQAAVDAALLGVNHGSPEEQFDI